MTYHTKSGSKNCITITNPSVTKMIPKFRSNIRQHIPLMFGQKGLGAAIASIVIPAFREPLDFLVLAIDGAIPLLPLLYE